MKVNGQENSTFDRYRCSKGSVHSFNVVFQLSARLCCILLDTSTQGKLQKKLARGSAT